MPPYLSSTDCPLKPDMPLMRDVFWVLKPITSGRIPAMKSKTVLRVRHSLCAFMGIVNRLDSGQSMEYPTLTLWYYECPTHSPTGIFSPARMWIDRRFSAGVIGHDQPSL